MRSTRLAEVPGITIHGPAEAADRGALVSFVLDGAHPHDVGEILGREGVCVRAGHHCAQPLMRRLGVAATTRASFAVHNTPADIDRLIEALGTVASVLQLSASTSQSHGRPLPREHPRALQAPPQLEPARARARSRRPRVPGPQPAVRRRATVELAVGDDGRIEDVRFSGHGCAISQAAASMASDEVKGMKVDELLKLDRSFVLDLLGIDISATADEVRAAVAEGAQERLARAGRRLGARDARERGGLSDAASADCRELGGGR